MNNVKGENESSDLARTEIKMLRHKGFANFKELFSVLSVFFSRKELQTQSTG